MRERVVLIPNFVEKVDLVSVKQERSCDAMNRRVSPSLQCNAPLARLPQVKVLEMTYLVVETSLSIKVFEEGHVSWTSPKVHVSYLEV